VKNSRLWASLIGFTAVVGVLFGVILALDRTPVLGLDLKGGLSVIYATAEPAGEDELIVVRDLMRDQLESFGIAEPDVRVEGDNIIVDLPGVADQSEAFDALNVSGIVELRPVIQCQAATVGDTSSTSVPSATSQPPGSSPSVGTAPGATTPASTAPATSGEVTPGDESASGFVGSDSPFPRVVPPAPATTAPPATAPTGSVPASTPVTTAPPIVGPTLPTTTLPVETLPPDTSGQEILPLADGQQVCLVGPSGGTGEVFERGSAAAGIDQNTGQWVVTTDLRSDGQAAWNALAQQCYSGSATCPSRQLAIVLDDVIQTAPTVNEPNFPGTVQISGAFTEDEVRDLARVINRGAFPVTVVQQRVETVSPTAGENSLRSAVLAGLIGVALMLAYMVFYYRRLSVVIILSLAVWAVTVFVMASFVSNQWSYAFTIAGATGLIISVGVTVDTYVVFFERIRDELRHGRSITSAAPRSFKATWRTILAANFIALLAAVVLFWLSVGSVKGFALYLGMTTVCDLLVFWFVARPATFLLAQTRWLRHAERSTATAPIGATS
jgi:preprotein translocase subunit SecD